MIGAAEFYAALLLGACLGGAIVEYVRRRRPHRNLFCVSIYNREGPADPTYWQESSNFWTVMDTFQKALGWPGVHHIVLQAPHGAVYTWHNPRQQK